jgi:anthranilate/para-aminobenzoate synthase component I
MWAERVASIDELAVAQSLSGQAGFAWLDSNRSESRDGRYSFLAAWPNEEIRVEFGDRAPFSALANVTRPVVAKNGEGPSPSEVPAWIGYIAYDAFWSAPARGKPRFERGREPILLFRRYPALLAIDHEAGEAWIVGDERESCEDFRAFRSSVQCKSTIPRLIVNPS